MKNIKITFFICIQIIFGCEYKKKSTQLTANDTISVLKTVLNNKEFSGAFHPGKKFQIYQKGILKQEYKFIVRGLKVNYITLDSCRFGPKDWLNPSLILNLDEMKFLNDSTCKGIISFRCVGILAEFKAKKMNNLWKVETLIPSQI